MSQQKATKGNLIAGKVTVSGGLTLGAGSAVKAISAGTVTVDPASLGTNASAETAVTIAGVAVGDVVIFTHPSGLDSGISYDAGRVSAADTVQLRLTNTTAGSVDVASADWAYLWIDLT